LADVSFLKNKNHKGTLLGVGRMQLSERLLKAVAYLVYRHFKLFGKGVDRLKLMKLLFLVDYDLTKHPPQKRGLTGLEWKIYLWGPYAYDVYCAKDQLVEKGILVEAFPYRTLLPDDEDALKKLIDSLDGKLKQVIDEVLARYGDRDGIDLTYLIYRILQLTPARKHKYFEMTIDNYLRELKREQTA